MRCLIRPIQPRDGSGLVYARSEFYQEEADTRPRAKKGARVVRGYYLLDELAPGGETGARAGAPLLVRPRRRHPARARCKLSTTRGRSIRMSSYTEPKNFGEDGRLVDASRIELTRPHDRYKLSVSYQSPEAVVFDREYRAEVFVLENKWQLPEVRPGRARKAAANNGSDE